MIIVRCFDEMNETNRPNINYTTPVFGYYKQQINVILCDLYDAHC